MTHFARGLPIDDSSGRILQVSFPNPAVGKDGKIVEIGTGKLFIDGLAPAVSAGNGFTFTAEGALRINGVTASLPPLVIYQNGLPFDGTGALFTDGSNPIRNVCGGVPFTTIGAVAVS